MLTFVVPVRHPESAKEWGRLKANLAQTVRSIAAQDAGGWKAVIAANAGLDLPALL